MTIQQVAAELGLPVRLVRAAARDVYRTSRPKAYTPRHVRVLRWALVMQGVIAE